MRKSEWEKESWKKRREKKREKAMENGRNWRRKVKNEWARERGKVLWAGEDACLQLMCTRVAAGRHHWASISLWCHRRIKYSHCRGQISGDGGGGGGGSGGYYHHYCVSQTGTDFRSDDRCCCWCWCSFSSPPLPDGCRWCYYWLAFPSLSLLSTTTIHYYYYYTFTRWRLDGARHLCSPLFGLSFLFYSTL